MDKKLIIELRNRTGLGLGKCRKALLNNNNDVEAAIEALRKQGSIAREKKAHRTQKEGVIVSKEGDGKVVLLSFLSETDFVLRTDDVKDFLARAVESVFKQEPDSVEVLEAMDVEGRTAREWLEELVAKIGENLGFGDIYIMRGETIGCYVHHTRKLAALVKLEGGGDVETAAEIAMHCVFGRPESITREEVPAEKVEHERTLIIQALKQDPKMASKPENVLEKIAEGKLGKFYSEIVLLEQPYIMETKLTVGKYLEQKAPGAKITDFHVMEVGG